MLPDNCQYEPKDTMMDFVNSGFGMFLNAHSIPWNVRADDHCIVTDINGIQTEIEPYQYLYVREDGTMYAEWE